jgi:hypothetical protein
MGDYPARCGRRSAIGAVLLVGAIGLCACGSSESLSYKDGHAFGVQWVGGNPGGLAGLSNSFASGECKTEASLYQPHGDNRSEWLQGCSAAISSAIAQGTHPGLANTGSGNSGNSGNSG